MTPSPYPGALFEQANPFPGYPRVRYRVISESKSLPGWWLCEASTGGQREIPGRALMNPKVYRSVT